MSMSIEIGTFHWTTGHRRNFATKSGGDQFFNRLTKTSIVSQRSGG